MGLGDVPLRFRLPNPPAPCLGRDGDAAWLTSNASASALSVVVGPRGIGKTALVCHALHTHPTERLVFIERAGSRPLLAAARALAQAGPFQLDWPALLASAEQLAALAIDLAEAGAWTVVLDDVDPSEEAREALRCLCRYARRARWIATTTWLPELPDSKQRIRVLGPLNPVTGRELARRLAPQLTDAQREAALQRSAGVPAELRAAVIAAQHPGAELPVPARALYGVLLRLGVAVPELALEDHRDALEQLVAAGRVSRRGSDIEASLDVDALADVDRDLLGGVAAKWLECASGPSHRLAALACLSAAGDTSALRRGLDEHASELLAAGYAAELSGLFDGLQPLPRSLLAVRFAAAAELGGAAAVALGGLPDDASVSELLAFSRLALSRGDLDAAQQAAERAEAAPAADDGDRFEATLLRVRLAALLGRPQLQRQLLEAAQPVNAAGRARRDVRLAQCLVAQGDSGTARRLVDKLLPLVDALDAQTGADVRYGMAHVLYVVGELGAAADVLMPGRRKGEGDAPQDVTPSPEFVAPSSRQQLTFQAVLALDTGRLEDCRELLERLEPHAPAESTQRPFVDAIAAQRHLARGDMTQAREAIESMLRAARRQRSGLLLGSALALAERLAVALGPDHSPPNPEPGDPEVVAPFAELLESVRDLRRLRRGEMLSPTRSDTAVPELSIRRGVTLAVADLLAGRAEPALSTALAARQRAQEMGHALLEAEALRLETECLVVLDRGEALTASLHGLSGLADRVALAALRDDATLLGLLRSAADAAQAEQLAASACSPETRRRARALLGSDVNLDALDTLVVGAIRRRGFDVRTLCGDAARAGWGMEPAARAVWLPSGAVVDLASRPQLWRLLDELARCRRATKEQLAKALWPEEEYHPLRHDNRLQAQVRQLRRAVESAPGERARIVTTEDGYAVGTEEPLRRFSEPLPL